MLRAIALPVVVGLTLAGAPLSTPPSGSPDAIGEPFTAVSTGPCPDSRYECTTLAVPRDHADPAGPTWEVTYGFLPAAVESHGTLVTITGGPGTSGLWVADSYTDYMAPSITDFYDLVFIDQRGIGKSQPVRCEEAAAAYYQSDADPADPAQRDQVAAAAERFVDDCVAESGVAEDDLPFFATSQAVEDLEAIRQHLGIDQFVLYGESYGTQYAQTYASAHPEHVSMLVLDGVVDLTVDALDYYEEGAQAHDDALRATLAACTDDETCGLDAGGDALAAYDELAGRLAVGPIGYDFPMPDGTAEPRTFTLGDLETAAAANITSLADRMLLQRAVAAAAEGDLVPLARLAYAAVAVDPETLEVEPDPGWSDAMYYAVECQDYEFLPADGTPRERLDAWLDRGAAAGVNDLRLGSVFYGDLPCLYWPRQPASVPRPAPIVDAPYPTLVLTADTDAPTPVANAMRVFGRLEDSSLVLLQGGPHVIFDWGYACVDDLVSDAIATGEPPATRFTICPGDVADPYVAIPPADVDAYLDPEAAASIVADQLTASSDYTYWDGSDVMALGCDHGGAVVYQPTETGADVTLSACELTDGAAISGDATIDFDTGGVTLDITLPDGTSTHAER